MTDFFWFPALVLGLTGGLHCLGMCGGIAMALGLTSRPSYAWLYNLARITSYLLAATIFWALVQFSPSSPLPLLKLISALLLIFTALYFLDLPKGLLQVEKAGRWLWRFIEPLGRKLVPINHPIKAILAGLVWGWIPCGLAYTAIFMGLSQPSYLHSSLFIVVFGLATLPSMLGLSWFATHLKPHLSQGWLKRVFALLLLLMGIWSLYQALDLLWQRFA